MLNAMSSWIHLGMMKKYQTILNFSSKDAKPKCLVWTCKYATSDLPNRSMLVKLC